MTTISPKQIAALPDRELLEAAKRLAAIERSSTVDVIFALAEVERRSLHLGEGYSSMFDYCTRALHFSEHAAYGRIEASRLARRFPMILELLRGGAVTLTTVGLLAPHLTDSNHAELLSDASHKSKRKVEELVARLSPRPHVATSVRKLAAACGSSPERTAAPGPSLSDVASAGQDSQRSVTGPRPLDLAGDVTATATLPRSPKPAAITALAPERYSVRVTISREAHDQLRRAQDLLRHSIPSGDAAVIIERALALLVADLERRKLAIVASPAAVCRTVSRTRHVPASVKREVWTRDGGQCAFEGTDGRCEERAFLEFHHVTAFADGGEASVDNIELRCRAHNMYEAALLFPIAGDEDPSFNSVRDE